MIGCRLHQHPHYVSAAYCTVHRPTEAALVDPCLDTFSQVLDFCLSLCFVLKLPWSQPPLHTNYAALRLCFIISLPGPVLWVFFFLVRPERK